MSQNFYEAKLAIGAVHVLEISLGLGYERVRHIGLGYERFRHIGLGYERFRHIGLGYERFRHIQRDDFEAALHSKLNSLFMP